MLTLISFIWRQQEYGTPQASGLILDLSHEKYRLAVQSRYDLGPQQLSCM